jgi:hypothetical protein
MRATHRPALIALLGAAMLCALTSFAGAKTILFVGNSFTYGELSPVMRFKPQSVTDLNRTGIGGVPALFKEFTVQAGLDYEVSLETVPGIGLDYHFAQKRALLDRNWDERWGSWAFGEIHRRIF